MNLYIDCMKKISMLICTVFVLSIQGCGSESNSSVTQDQVESSEPSIESNVEFVGFTDEFISAYPESWALILSCKKFFDRDISGAWAFNIQYDKELEKRGKFRLLGINQAFEIVINDGPQNSPDEMNMIQSMCREILTKYNNKDSRITLPSGDFWKSGRF